MIHRALVTNIECRNRPTAAVMTFSGWPKIAGMAKANSPAAGFDVGQREADMIFTVISSPDHLPQPLPAISNEPISCVPASDFCFVTHAIILINVPRCFGCPLSKTFSRRNHGKRPAGPVEMEWRHEQQPIPLQGDRSESWD
jgi:hypothetical protein